MMVEVPPDNVVRNGNDVHHGLLPLHSAIFPWQDDFIADKTHGLHLYNDAPIRPKHVDILLGERTDEMLHPEDYVGPSPSTEKIHDIATFIQTANRDMEVHYITCHRDPDQDAPLVALAGFEVNMVGSAELSEIESDRLVQYVEERINPDTRSEMVRSAERGRFWWEEPTAREEIIRELQ